MDSTWTTTGKLLRKSSSELAETQQCQKEASHFLWDESGPPILGLLRVCFFGWCSDFSLVLICSNPKGPTWDVYKNVQKQACFCCFGRGLTAPSPPTWPTTEASSSEMASLQKSQAEITKSQRCHKEEKGLRCPRAWL